MAENKTQPTTASVPEFLAAITDRQRRQDCQTLVTMMQELTGVPPVLWGTSIVGFGRVAYTYASGRRGEWFLLGFSPRKQDLSLYLMGCGGPDPALLARLGKHRRGVACLYLKRLAGIDLGVLRELCQASLAASANRHA
jgi:hypothetical protein